MKLNITYRSLCRLCGSSDLRRFLHFANIPLADGLVDKGEIGTEFLADINIYWCAECKSVQTQHDVEISEYYHDYHYVPSVSSLVRAFMERLSDITLSKFGLKPGDSVIEIGSADGYQLSCFQNRGARVLGFEPSVNLVELSNKRNVSVINALFTPDSIDLIPQSQLPAQVIMLSHTFDHLPDPVPFLDTVKEILDPVRGVLLLEVHDLRKIVDRRETILFAHEHATFLHSLTMERLLNQCGFDLLAVNFIPDEKMRGNSLLVAAALKGSHLTPNTLPKRELFADLERWETYPVFEKTVRASYKGLKQYVKEQRSAGRKIAGYGAGGRGVMATSMARLDRDDLEFICDRNINFQGLFTPGSNIIVVSPEHLLDHFVDEVIVFSFGYMNEIREALVQYLKAGGRLTSLLDLI